MAERVFVDDTHAEPHALAPAAPEGPPRPKVMRRPPQFSQVPASGTAPRAHEEPLPAAPTPTPAITEPAQDKRTAERAWQDDPVFGLALIVTLAALNLALIFLIPHLAIPGIPEEKSQGLVLFGSTSMPPVKQDEAGVTTYADPQAQRRLSDTFDLEQMTPGQNELSVSPKDIPPPAARALDNGGP